jgi:mRNA interferase HigB
MRVITPQRIRAYVQQYPEAGTSLGQWLQTTNAAQWQSLADVRRQYAHADLVGRRTVFNIAGNKFRLITRINYRRHIIFVFDLLTHTDYDKGKWK